MSFETSFDSKQLKLEPKLVRRYPKQNVCFGCFASIPKQRVSMFQLNQNKQKSNRNNLKASIFCYFLQKILAFLFFLVFWFFQFFSVCFETVCFGCFASIPKQRVSMFQLSRNKQKTHPNSLKESIFGYLSENLWLFRFVLVCYETVLFVWVVDIGSKHRNKPKFFVLGFTKQTEINPKQILLPVACLLVDGECVS